MEENSQEEKTSSCDESAVHHSEESHSYKPETTEQKPSCWYGQLTTSGKIEVWSTIIVAFSTLVMAGFTIALWWTSDEQLGQIKVQTKAMQDQLSEMKSGSEDTKTIAESAKAQAESTKVMAEAMLLDQRAWVGPYKVSDPKIIAGSPVYMEIHYVNEGKTPARKFMTTAAMIYQPSHVKFIPEFKALKTSQAATVIFPHMAVTSNMSEINLRLDQSQVDQLRNGSFRLYVFGKYSYSTLNIDGGGTFCMFFQRTLTQAPGWCDSYNDQY